MVIDMQIPEDAHFLKILFKISRIHCWENTCMVKQLKNGLKTCSQLVSIIGTRKKMNVKYLRDTDCKM